MSFALLKFTTVLLKSINVRAEMHGKDPVPAADIGFRLVCANTALDMFDAGLRHAFYRATTIEGEEPQHELDGIDPKSETPELRTTSIDMPVDLIREYVGRQVTIDYGLGGKSNIEVSADINQFKVGMKEGGTIDLDFRVQVSGLDGPTLGKLAALVKHDVKITIASSPEADGTQEQVPGTSPFKYSAAADGKVTDNATGKDATQLFSEANTPPETKAAAKKTAPAKHPKAGPKKLLTRAQKPNRGKK